jgi:hypothetical protein
VASVIIQPRQQPTGLWGLHVVVAVAPRSTHGFTICDDRSRGQCMEDARQLAESLRLLDAEVEIMEPA